MQNLKIYILYVHKYIGNKRMIQSRQCSTLLKEANKHVSYPYYSSFSNEIKTLYRTICVNCTRT